MSRWNIQSFCPTGVTILSSRSLCHLSSSESTSLENVLISPFSENGSINTSPLIYRKVDMNFREYVSRTERMHTIGSPSVSEELRYHIERGMGLHDNVFRIYSEAWFALVNEARTLYEAGQLALVDEDAELGESNIGQKAQYRGRTVRIDAPVPLKERLDEAEYKGKKVSVGKPFRTPGEGKKFAVYVKSPGGRIKKVRFGDPNLTVKNNNPARAKSFRARHKCSEKKDRTKAGYWACRIGRYAKSVGLKSSKSW